MGQSREVEKHPEAEKHQTPKGEETEESCGCRTPRDSAPGIVAKYLVPQRKPLAAAGYWHSGRSLNFDRHPGRSIRSGDFRPAPPAPPNASPRKNPETVPQRRTSSSFFFRASWRARHFRDPGAAILHPITFGVIYLDSLGLAAILLALALHPPALPKTCGFWFDRFDSLGSAPEY